MCLILSWRTRYQIVICLHLKGLWSSLNWWSRTNRYHCYTAIKILTKHCQFRDKHVLKNVHEACSAKKLCIGMHTFCLTSIVTAMPTSCSISISNSNKNCPPSQLHNNAVSSGFCHKLCVLRLVLRNPESKANNLPHLTTRMTSNSTSLKDVEQVESQRIKSFFKKTKLRCSGTSCP